MNRNEDNKKGQIPENDPSKPMNSKRDVANSPDEKTDEDFPGYPHYPSKEDIMDESTGSHRVDADLENMGTGPNASGVSGRYQGNSNSGAEPGNIAEGEGGGGTDGNNNERGVPQNVTNDELEQNDNLPGTDIQEAAEKGSTNP